MRTVWAAIWSRSPSTAPSMPPICAPSPACFTPSGTSSGSATTLVNLQESAQELHEQGAGRFSASAREEVEVLTLRCWMASAGQLTLRSFQAADDGQTARQVEPLEETMDLLTEEIRSRHIRRLQSGQCTIQLGFILNDLLNNAERVGDHCSNIAVSVIEEQEKQAASHAYLHSLKKNDEFSFQLQQNLSRYVLPAETSEDQPAE